MRTMLVAIAMLALGAPALAGGAPHGDHPATTEAKSAEKAPMTFDSPPPVGTKARCPVMGGEFTVTEETKRSEHDGKHVVFCCPGCKPKFDAAPEKYLKDA